MLIDVKEHPDYPGTLVGTDGTIYRRYDPVVSFGGYHTVKLPITGGKHVTIRRHTLVLETYHGPSNGRVARHGKLGPGDDSVGNLQWGSQADNCADTVAHGHSTKGERNAQAKLSAQGAMEIYQRYRAGESGSALAREFGISQPTVVDIAQRRTWRHIHTTRAITRRRPA